MKELLRNSLLVLLSLLLIISVSGVNIYLHHCSCEGIRYATAVPVSDCCDHGGDHSVCCTVTANEASCCSEGEENCPADHLNAPECCTSQHLFLKLSTDLDIKVKQNIVHYLTAFMEDLTADHPATTSLSNIFERSLHFVPARLHGKYLLTSLHQLRIDC